MAKQDEKYTVTGRFTDNFSKLVIDHADKLGRLFAKFADDQIEITIKKFYKNRSVAQNNWVWGVAIPTIRAWMRENGQEVPTAEGLYAYLRIEIAGQEVVIEEIAGRDCPIIEGKRFSDMNTIEFSEVMEKIVQFYAELGLEIPLPIEKTNNLITDYLKAQGAAGDQA